MSDIGADVLAKWGVVPEDVAYIYIYIHIYIYI